MLTSCDISDDYESFSESFYPDFKINNVSGKDLWNPHPDIGLRIDEIHNNTLLKSGNQKSGMVLDTTSILVIQAPESTSYIFKFTGDTLNEYHKKNYLLVQLNDSLWHQYRVDYSLDNNNQLKRLSC